jgi:anaerobic selenocysteine-containing dehydrogenase
VYLDRDDAAAIGVVDGDAVRLASADGEMVGRVKLVRLPRGSVQVHWPEGNVLLPTGHHAREPHSRIPDYNAIVTITRVDGAS